MAYGKKVTNDHKRAVFETASGCFACDGPLSIFKRLGEWSCDWKGCGGTANRPNNAYCYKKGCGGLPPLQHGEEQAVAQEKHKA